MAGIVELQPDAPGTEYPESVSVKHGNIQAIFKNIGIPLIAALGVTFILFFPNIPLLGYFRKTLGNIALFLWGLIGFILLFSNTTTFKMSVNQQKYVVYGVIILAFTYTLLFNIDSKEEVPPPEKEILLDVYALYNSTLTNYISSNNHSLEEETLVFSDLLTKMAVKLTELESYTEKKTVDEIVKNTDMGMFIKAFKVMKAVKKSLVNIGWKAPKESEIQPELKDKIDQLKNTLKIIEIFNDSLVDGWGDAPIPDLAKETQEQIMPYYKYVKELDTIGKDLIKKNEINDAELVYTELFNKLKVLLCENKLDFEEIIKMSKDKKTDVITREQINEIKLKAKCLGEKSLEPEKFTQNNYSSIHKNKTESIQDLIDTKRILYVRST